MNVHGLTRFAIAACLALAVFLPRPAEAGGFNPAIGNYLNPDSVGWGLDVQRIGDFIFVLWFTYRPDGSPVWYLSAAELDGMSWTATIEEYSWKTKTATPTTVGNMSLAWSDTENATFSWTLDGVSGELPVAFLHFDTGLTTANHTGHYVAPEELGWGASILSQGDTSAMFLYFYDQNGDAVWMLGVDATPGMQQDFVMNRFFGPGLCPSCIAGKEAREINAKTFPEVVIEVRFLSIEENFLQDVGVDFRDIGVIGALNTLPGTVNPNTPLGSDPLSAIDVPEDDGFNDGPYATINALTPSPNVFLLPELQFFMQPTKVHLDPAALVTPIVCNNNLTLEINVPEPGSTGYPQPSIGGNLLNLSYDGETAPAQVGVSKVGDKSISVNLQAAFSGGRIAGFNMIARVPEPGQPIIGGLLVDEVTITNTVPFLNEIPVLGALFKRKVYRANNSELQILVCAHIVEEVAGR